VTGDGRLEELRAEVRYRRARLALLRAKLYSKPTTTSGKSLPELERAFEGARDRLRRAEGEHGAGGSDPQDTPR